MNDETVLDVRSNLKPEALELYDRWCETVQAYLVEVRMHWFFAKKIEEFDRKLFGLDFSGDFWDMTRFAHIHTCLSRIWSLVADTDSDAMTLSKMLGFIDENIQTLDPERAQRFRRDFGNHIDRRDFHKRIKDIRDRLDAIRHKVIAHLDQVYLGLKPPKDGNSPSLRRLTRIELDGIVRDVEDLWDKINPGIQRALMPWHYADERKLSESRTDIDELLDLAASKSAIVNLPEKSPELWKLRRKELSLDHLTKINRVRKKFGMSGVE